MRINLTVVKKGIILTAIPLLFELILVGVVAVAGRQNAEAVHWAVHSKEVLGEARTVGANLADANSSATGYIFTEKAIFAEAFAVAVRDLRATLERLQELVSDNPGQEACIRRIAAATVKLTDWYADSVRLVRSGASAEAIARVKSTLSTKSRHHLNQDIEAFLKEEQRLDQVRAAAVVGAQQQLRWLLAAGAGISIVGTVLLALVLGRGIARGLAALADNTRRLSEGRALRAPLGGSDELAHLDTAFRDMVRQLELSQEGLRSQTTVLQSVLDNMGDGVAVANEHGKFLLFNPAAEQILGKGPVETSPAQWTEEYGVYLPDAVTPFPPERIPLARALRGEAVDAVEMIIRHRDVSAGIWVSATARPLRGGDGRVRGGVVVFRDISAAKRAEEALHSLNEELEYRVVARTAELANANRDLEQQNQENEMFVYSVSHDLRSPLVNLQGFSQELGMVASALRDLLTGADVPPDVRARGQALVDGDMAESMHFIQAGVMRLSNIIDALLRLSRAGRVEYRQQVVDVPSIVGQIIESMNGTIAARGAVVTVQDLPQAWGDKTAVEQIFANLLGNALNYLDPKRPGLIEVGSVDVAEGAAVGLKPSSTYYVKDNGLGIPAPYAPKMFKAFQRLHGDAAKGEGIGLVLVRRIIERHGGKIWFESIEGAGTTFFVTLPAPVSNTMERRLVSNRAVSEERELALCQANN